MHLTLHLDSAALLERLGDSVAALRRERDVRERFVSVLAHDLRGPLSAAKVAAHVLIQHPEKLDERRDLAIRIDRSIDRTDRMIRDLLDASRIRAGERLPLRLDACDLGAIAREVVDELSAIEGDRFILRAPGGARGVWSAEELRRALWNLVSNAVKYGAAERPIVVEIRASPGGVEASVHNEGEAIRPAEQARLFDAFSRTPSADASEQGGWGLGLTLVRGCAEAHGGTIQVESAPGKGTTFTLRLPWDSRAPQVVGPSGLSAQPAVQGH
jgi:signal transduction histidine kinase